MDHGKWKRDLEFVLVIADLDLALRENTDLVNKEHFGYVGEV